MKWNNVVFVIAVILWTPQLAAADPNHDATSSSPPSTQSPWKQYAGHRQNVMTLLRNLTKPTVSTTLSSSAERQMILLGAGACYDVSLTALTSNDIGLAAVHLADISGSEIAGGISRQQQIRNNRIVAQIVDLSGIHSCLHLHKQSYINHINTMKSTSDRHDGMDSCIEAARHYQAHNSALPTAAALNNAASSPVFSSVSTYASYRGPYHYVASMCMMSQLVPEWIVAGEQRYELMIAARNAHIQLMLDLTLPSARGILITDAIAVHTLPQLPSWSSDDLSLLNDESSVMKWLQQRSQTIPSPFYDTMSPTALLSIFTSSSLVARAYIVPRIWWWHASSHQQYLVIGIAYERNNRVSTQVKATSSMGNMFALEDLFATS